MLNTILRSQIKSIFLATIAISMAMILVLYPEQAVFSSVRGLKIWWEVVFPALLPFFITAEMLMGFGVVHFLGVILEPLMRPIFRVPGVGGFVMAVGLISGNPMGAKLTSKLREQKLISKEEGERLVSFTSTAGPLFIFGAVGVGFFESTSVGIILAIAHYLGSFLVGFIMRFHKINVPLTPIKERKSGMLFVRAIRSLHQARILDGRPIGQLLGEAVTSAVQTLLLIGGFIIIFSVITHLINYVGIAMILSNLLSIFLSIFHIPVELSRSLFTGFFEMTLGSQLASTLTNIPLLFKLAIVSALIGFNGLSIHAQVVSMLSRTDIRYVPYLFARILHALCSCLITFMIFNPLQPYFSHLPASVPAFTSTIINMNIHLWKFLQDLSFVIILLWIVFKIYAWLTNRIYSIPKPR